MVRYVCPACHQPLDGPHCGAEFAISDGIADFAEGRYYDTFSSENELTPEHRIGLAAEITGSRWRIEEFYLPLISGASTVLDCGCGNGVSVDVLNEHGFDAWGLDLSALRKWQWRERTHREKLSVADALHLPFEDGAFDIVISSGVIEHIGVEEMGGTAYSVQPMPQRDELRQTFIDELLRVTKPGGRVFVDAPNGRFPIDFWHGGAGGRARFHSPDEGFLPHFADVVRLARGNPTRALSPRRRFAFKQVGQHWYGRLFAVPMRALFALMTVAPFLARTALNPYLVIEIRKQPAAAPAS